MDYTTICIINRIVKTACGDVANTTKSEFIITKPKKYLALDRNLGTHTLVKTRPSLVQMKACSLFGTKLLHEPTMSCYQIDSQIKPRYNVNQNAIIFFREVAFENVI